MCATSASTETSPADRNGVGADLGGNGPGGILAQVVDDHAIAVAGQPLCDGASDARACAGDDGDAHAMSSWIAARPARRTLSVMRMA